MNWIKFHLSKNYLFSKIPPKENNLLILLLIFFIILIIGSLIINYIYNNHKIKPYYQIIKDKIIINFTIIGFLGLLLVFFRWQEIPYFSSPILILILMLVFLMIIIYNIIYYKKNIMPEIDKYNLEQNYQKYLPKKKINKKHI